jgi:hypothetical protein
VSYVAASLISNQRGGNINEKTIFIYKGKRMAAAIDIYDICSSSGAIISQTAGIYD